MITMIIATIFCVLYVIDIVFTIKSNRLQRKKIELLEEERETFKRVAKLNCDIWNCLVEIQKDNGKETGTELSRKDAE